MSIKPKFRASDVKAVFDKRLKEIENAITLRLQRLGEMCVNHARLSGDYSDQTGNLRSSIGYVIVVNGKIIITGGFEIQLKGSKGTSTGQQYAKELSRKFASGYTLIVVAGMDYAYHVETTGRNVLSSAEHLAQTQLPIMMNQLKAKLK
jgi:hypothetical protein